MDKKYMFIDGAYLRGVVGDFGEYWYGQRDVPFEFDRFADDQGVSWILCKRATGRTLPSDPETP